MTKFASRSARLLELPSSSTVFLFALNREWQVLRRRTESLRRIPDSPCPAFRARLHDSDILILETGVGRRRITRALQWLFESHFSPGLIVSCGYSGALRADLRVGDIVIATEVIAAQDRKLPSPALPCADFSIGAIRGSILCTDSMVADPAEKERLGNHFAAIAVDMETAAVAEACLIRDIPYACVRVISDTMTTRLSPQLTTLLSGGQASLLKVLTALLRTPKLLPELLRLSRDTSIASQQLAVMCTDLLGRRTCSIKI